MKKKKERKFLHYLLLIFIWGFALLFFGLILGTITHEVIGHGLTAISFGNPLIAVEILVFRIDSTGFSLVPFNGFGTIWWEDSTQPTIHSLVFTTIMASVVPLIISIIFAFLLLFGKQTGLKKILFTCFAMYFIDPLCNYFIWPYLSGGGGDFRGITNFTGFNLLPFSIIALASSLVISSIIIYSFFGHNKKNIKNIFSVLLIILSFSLVFYLFYLVIFGSIMSYNGFEYCQKIDSVQRMNGCTYSMALEKLDPSICKTFSEPNKTSNCIWDVSYLSQNITLCQEVIIPGETDSCISAIAQKTKNLTICNYISNKTFSQECLDQTE